MENWDYSWKTSVTGGALMPTQWQTPQPGPPLPLNIKGWLLSLCLPSVKTSRMVACLRSSIIVNRKYHSNVCSMKQREIKVSQTVTHWYSNIYASARLWFQVLKDQKTWHTTRPALMYACKMQVWSCLTRMPFINSTWQCSVKPFFMFICLKNAGQKISPNYLKYIFKYF